MTEVLYCPINNELFLLIGSSYNAKTNTITLSLYPKTKGVKIKDVSQLVHIGWL